MSYQSQAPNMLHVVEQLARQYPREFDDCHRPERGHRAWLFGEIVASVLHYQHNARFGWNGKRGNVGDPSMDAVAWLEPTSPAGGVDIIDVVAHAGETDPRKPQPEPAWIDQTQATADHGTIGAWIKPRPLREILADAGNPTQPVDPPPGGGVIPPVTSDLAEVLRLLQSQQARLAALEEGQRALGGGIGTVATAVGDLNEVVQRLADRTVKRIFGELVEDNGVQHPGVPALAAQKAVDNLYERNGKAGGALRVKLR